MLDFVQCLKGVAMTSETFEQVLAAAQADGSYTPAWKKFIKTKFYVPVHRSVDDNPRNFTLRLSQAAGGAAPILTISEIRARVEAQYLDDIGALASLSGADVVKMLQAEAGILVALSESAFGIARERVEWLKKGLEAGQARAAAKGQPAPPVVQPAAKPVVQLAAVPIAAPLLRRAPGPLNVAALAPRNVTIAKLGLEFFVPGSWAESRISAGMRYHDPVSGTVVEATGFHRANVSLAQFVAMRLELVRQEMRYLRQDGESTPIDGAAWRDRIKGVATEFTGTVPGDDGASRFLLACIRIDGTQVAVTIRARAQAFEDNRDVYQWMLGRVDISEAAAVDASAGVFAALPRRSARAWPLAAAALLVLAAGGYALVQANRPDAGSTSAVAAAPVFEKDRDSAVFTVPDGSFSVELPGAPQEVVIPKVVRDSLGKVTMRQFKLARAGRVYMVQSIDYGKAPANAELALIGMQSSVVGRDGEMVSAAPINLNGAKGREVRADLPGGMVRAARFALVGSKVCMVMIAVKDKPESLAHVNAFLESFELAKVAGR